MNAFLCMIWVRISDLWYDHADHSTAKESTNPLWERIHRVFLMDHDPSDLGSLILIRVMPKEPTLKTLTQINFMIFVLVKKRVNARAEIAQATNSALDNVRSISAIHVHFHILVK